MTYRIELAEYLTEDWVKVAEVDQSMKELTIYLCIIKRMHPGSQVRACDSCTNEVALQV